MSDAQPQISVTFSQQELGVVRAGLLELPGKHALPILLKLERLQQQAQQPRAGAPDMSVAAYPGNGVEEMR